MPRQTQPGSPWTSVRKAWTRVPLYPLMLALSTVFVAQTEIGISLAAVMRSALIAATLSVVLIALWWAITRDLALAGVIAAAMILVLRSGGAGPAVTAALLGVLCAGAVVWGSRRSPEGWRPRGTGILNTIGAPLLVIALGGSLYAEVASVASVPPAPELELDPSDPLPDVYVILLDAYSRADALERTTGFDNGEFIAELESRGLSISTDARSNFMYTAPSLMSFFDLGQMGAVGRSIRTERAALRPSDAINGSPAMDVLDRAGYTTFAAVARWERETLRVADHVCGTEPINEFESHLIRETLIGRALDVFAPGWRAARDRSIVSAEFDCAANSADPQTSTGPRFSFSHVGSPHTPIIFDAAGGAAPSDVYLDPLEVPASIAEQVDRAYVEQLEYINRETLRVIDRILEDSAEPPVIIVMADHGSWFEIGTDYDERSDLRERYSILFAASTPGHPDLFPDDVSVGQVLPILLNAYFGTDIEVPESRYFFSRTEDIFELVEIPDPLASR